MMFSQKRDLWKSNTVVQFLINFIYQKLFTSGFKASFYLTATLCLTSYPVASNATIILGPGLFTSTVNVNVEDTIIVGNSTVSISSGTTPATNVTGSNLTLNTTLGPSPGPIVIQTINGNALQANGGTINAFGASIFTQGGHAVLANGAASTVTLDNVSLSTTGTGAGLAAIGGTINASNTIINNLGTSSATVSAGHGAISESGGKINLGGGNSITTGAFNSVGLGASGVGSLVNVSSVFPVNLNGRGAMGVYVHDGGQVQLAQGFSLNMNASNSVGVSVDNTTVTLGTIGSGLNINLNGIPTAGQAASTGLVAMNNGQIAIENLHVSGAGSAAGAWARPGSGISLVGNSVLNINALVNPTYYTLATANLVTTNGPVSSIFNVTSGLPIGGLLSNAGFIFSDGTQINVTSPNGVGAFAGYNTASPMLSTIEMVSNAINTSGNASFGIEAASNSQIIGRDSEITTAGGGAAMYIFEFNGPASIDLTRSTVHATGFNTIGLVSENFSPNLINQVSLTDSILTSDAGTVIEAFGGPLNLEMTRSQALANTNFLLIDAIHSGFATQPTSVELISNDSNLVGDAQADSESFINLFLLNNSNWQGAAFNVTNVVVSPTSVWNMTKSSTVADLVANAGEINYVADGNNFKTLTTGNYIGVNGTIALNTFLGGDHSPSDLLLINGGIAAGQTALAINNTDGLGALTLGNGILVVNGINGGTTTDGAFSLARPVIAGPYEYYLVHGARDGSNPVGWYLVNEFNDPVEIIDVPITIQGPNGAPIVITVPLVLPTIGQIPRGMHEPLYRREVSLAAALPSTALLYDRTILGTLHQRVGEQEQLAFRKGPISQPFVNGAWLRVIDQSGHFENNGIYRAGPSFHFNFNALEIGTDIYHLLNANGSSDFVGIMGAYGQNRGDVDHVKVVKAGDYHFAAWTAGAYYTHYDPHGWYIDTVLQNTFHDITANSNRGLRSILANGNGVAGSIEGGYNIQLENGFGIEPETQLVLERLWLTNSRSAQTLFDFGTTNSVVGRIGARLTRTWEMGWGFSNAITAWIFGNIWREFNGDSKTDFTTLAANIPFNSNLKGNWSDTGIGLSAMITRDVSIYGTGNYTSFWSNHGSSAGGEVGIRLNL